MLTVVSEESRIMTTKMATKIAMKMTTKPNVHNQDNPVITPVITPVVTLAATSRTEPILAEGTGTMANGQKLNGQNVDRTADRTVELALYGTRGSWATGSKEYT